MRVGVPREIKPDEYRVATVPSAVRAFTGAGHEVLVEHGAGLGSGITDAEFQAAGATLCDRDELFGTGDMVMKVKEPLIQEWPLLRPGQLLFAYAHLAAAPELPHALMAKQVSAVAFEPIALP